MPADAKPLRDVLAAGVKAARQRQGLRQEDAAARARSLGLTAWIRGTVAQAEVGARRFALEEVLLLALAYETSLADLIAGDDADLVELTPEARLSVGALRSMFSGQPMPERPTTAPDSARPASQPRRFPDLLADTGRFGIEGRSALARLDTELGEAERHAARKLGVPANDITAAAQRLWGRSLSDERDQRLDERGSDQSARSRQALRGHITRELLSELAQELGG